MARARCSALFAAGTDRSSISATSAAENWSTSRRISTARWVPGSRCRAVTNASSRSSRRWYASSGPCTQGSRNTDPDIGRPRSAVCSKAGPDTSTRAGRRSTSRRQAWVAIRCSQVRTELRPSNAGSPRQAPRSASCSASSASWIEPVIR